MLTKNTCTLIYEEKTQYETILHEKTGVKFSELNIFNDRYYYTLGNANMRLSKMIKFREFYKHNYENGILRFVVIDGVKYHITKLSNVSGKYVTLDLEEHDV